MAEPASDSLSAVFRDVVRLLEQGGIPYLIIGGLAQSVIGEPRLTQDLDCIVSIAPTALQPLVQGLLDARFDVDLATARQRVESTGTFSVKRGHWRVDVILASTPFEQSAFQRAQRLRLYGVETNFPTPEDFILLKLVPGRDKDLLDAKTVIVRHQRGLDRAYLEAWAQRLSDEAEDARIWQTLQRLLRECG